MESVIIILLLCSYFLIALTALADKILLSEALPDPVVYTFFVSTLGLLALLIIPLGFFIPSWGDQFLNLLAGAFHTFAILFLYQALRGGEASRIFTTSGVLTAVLTFTLSLFFLGERLTMIQLIAFSLLVAGSVLIGLDFSGKKGSFVSLWLTILAAVAFAISYTATKAAFTGQGFTSAFVWIRIFAFAAALIFLFSREYRRQIAHALTEHAPLRKQPINQLILFGGQLTAGVGFFTLNLVISKISAAITLAAQGLQYVFLFIFTALLSRFFPRVLKEQISPWVLQQKIAAITLIFLGLILLGFY